MTKFTKLVLLSQFKKCFSMQLIFTCICVYCFRNAVVEEGELNYKDREIEHGHSRRRKENICQKTNQGGSFLRILLS